jgi:hypothetical protein
MPLATRGGEGLNLLGFSNFAASSQLFHAADERSPRNFKYCGAAIDAEDR